MRQELLYHSLFSFYLQHKGKKMCKSFRKRIKHCREFWGKTEKSTELSDPQVFGPAGSRSISQRYGSGSGSFPFLMKVLGRLKERLQNKILIQNFSKKSNFKTEDNVPADKLEEKI
jgi:hypothetical protein